MSEDIFNSPEVVVPGLGLILGSLILWSLIFLSLTIDFNTHFLDTQVISHLDLNTHDLIYRSSTQIFNSKVFDILILLD